MKPVLFVAAAIFGALLSGAAQAGTREDVLAGAIRCSGVAGDRQWLDCYYGAAQPMRAQLGLSPAPQAQQSNMPAPQPYYAPQPYTPQTYAPQTPVPPPPYAAASQATRIPPSPGFVQALTGDDPVVFSTQLVSYSVDQDGYFTATLANGQKWRQVSGEIGAHWPHAPSSYRVTVSRGMLGTFNFRVEGDPRLYKVKRLS